MSQAGKIKCDSCGRMYNWKAELAGKKIKCKCGQVFQAPAEPPQEEEQDQYDLAPEPEMEAKKPASRTVIPKPMPVGSGSAPVAAAPALSSGTKSPAGKVIPYLAPRKFGSNADPESVAELKKLIIPAVGVVLLIGLVIGARFLFHSVKANQKPALGQDGKVAELESEYGKTEALAWFNQSMHQSILGSIWTREQAQQRIKNWYNEGAKTVYAFGGVMTNSLAIELPDDPAKRKYFIDVAESWRAEHHWDRPAIKDVGQKYVMIDFW